MNVKFLTEVLAKIYLTRMLKFEQAYPSFSIAQALNMLRSQRKDYISEQSQSTRFGSWRLWLCIL